MARDLREPTGPPEASGFAGRDREIAELRSLLADGAEHLQPLVLHGPAGVGKSALAAAVSQDLGRPVHWISPGDTVDVERILLRLLAESGAPRVPIVRAALKRSRAFSRELWNEFARYATDRVLVLDDVHSSATRPLLTALRRCHRLTVFVTTREPSGWPRSSHLHEVRPLENVDALVVAATVARTDSAEPLAQLTTASRGLPSLARIAGALVKDGLREIPREVEGPDALMALALERCSLDEYRVLELLTLRESGAPFTLRTVESLVRLLSPSPDAAATVNGLLRRQLVQRWSEETGEFVLSAPLADAVRARARPGQPVRSQLAEDARACLEHSAHLLEGGGGDDVAPAGQFGPPDVASYADEFLDLVADDRAPLRQRLHIAGALAPVLAVLGDAHRLVWLYRQLGEVDIRVSRALAAIARDMGMPDHARILLSGDGSAHAVHARAAVEYQAGRLTDALAALEVRPPEADDIHAAWHSLVRGAVLCDQGDARGAEGLLRTAVGLHRRFDCRRGYGWALLHLARTYLMRGFAAEGEGLLAQAEQTLRSVGDRRGVNWVATERMRLPGALSTDPDARRTLAAHAKADDPRGTGWTKLFLAIQYAVAGTLGAARTTLGQADVHLVSGQDMLGSAWARHRLALLGPMTADEDRKQWELVYEQFLKTGCTRGLAWTGLELAARSPSPDTARYLLHLAESDFRALSDVRGSVWVEAVRAVRRDPPTRPDSAALTALLPPGLPDRDELMRDVEGFCVDGGPLGGRGIPFLARDLVVIDSTAADHAGLPGRNGPGCRVRITLLDDSPTAGTTACLLLRVVPEPGHPWASASAPWLTATALPVTRASVEPASALLRPSAQHGAEFDFTPHRTGTHRLRFTIALERTGTVLQQVETELDILDNDQPGSHTAPHAVIPRGR
ncbi:AAA family ATPase [Streptomyces sp. NPDC003635]